MPEPTTTAAATAITLSAASLLPFINGNALLGAVFGAALFATTKKDLKPLQRVLTMLLATGIGYLLTPEITSRSFISNDATSRTTGVSISVGTQTSCTEDVCLFCSRVSTTKPTAITMYAYRHALLL